MTRSTTAKADVHPKGELKWKPQELAFDDPRCRFFFDPVRKQVVATRGALAEFTGGEIARALEVLRLAAVDHGGLDYLQVFEAEDGRRLWVIEDGAPDDPEGVVTVLTPAEY